MDKIVLVDGNNLLFRSYYATAYNGNLMKNSKGFPTNALFGFINMLNKGNSIILKNRNTEVLEGYPNIGLSNFWNNHKDETEDKQAVTAKVALTERTSNWSSANGGKLSEEQMQRGKEGEIGGVFGYSTIPGRPKGTAASAFHQRQKRAFSFLR